MLDVKKVEQMTGHNASIFTVIDSSKAGHILSGGGDGWVVEWNLDDPEMGKLVAKVETQIFSMYRIIGTDRLVVGNMNGGIHWVDLADQSNDTNVLHHQKGVFAIVQVGNSIFTGGGDGLLTRWSIETRKAVESLQLSHASIRSIAFAPERNELAVGASDHHIYLVNATTMEIKYTMLNAHENSVFALRYGPRQRYLYSGGRDAHLKVWDLDSDRSNVSSQPAHWFTINDIAFHPNGKWLATGSRDKRIRIWDSQSFELLASLEGPPNQGHLNSVNRLYWSDHNDWLISASDDRRMIIWSVR